MRLITKGIIGISAFLLAWPAVAQTPSALEVVKKRGQVICGVNVGLGGFSLQTWISACVLPPRQGQARLGQGCNGRRA